MFTPTSATSARCYISFNLNRNNTMSKTPRTDKYGGYCAEYHKVNGMTLIQHARQLERENAELRKALNVVCEDRDYLYGQVMKLSPKTDENNQTTN